MSITTDQMIEINKKVQKAYDALMAADMAIFEALGDDVHHPMVTRLDKINDDLCEVFDEFGADYIKR